LVNQNGSPELWSEPRIIEMVDGPTGSDINKATTDVGAMGTPWQNIPLVWKLIVQRCIYVSRKQQGLALLTLRVLVNQHGVPQLWGEPSLLRLEPKARVTANWLNDKLSQTDLHRILVAMSQ